MTNIYLKVVIVEYLGNIPISRKIINSDGPADPGHKRLTQS